MALVHEQMCKALAGLSHIPKGKSSGVQYEFRSIDALMNHLHPVLAANGLFLAPRVLDDWQVNRIVDAKQRDMTQALFRVSVEVYAADGSSVTLGPGLAQSHDWGDKAVYQAQQNAIKYVLLEAFCIPTAEQDMDARDPSPDVPVDLSVVDEWVGRATEAGVKGDYDKMRAYASESRAQADATVIRLQQLVADATGDTTVDKKDDVPF